ncbi:MAG: hypothetical protein LQ341_006958, partial [Variospora aurantia]
MEVLRQWRLGGTDEIRPEWARAFVRWPKDLMEVMEVVEVVEVVEVFEVLEVEHMQCLGIL